MHSTIYIYTHNIYIRIHMSYIVEYQGADLIASLNNLLQPKRSSEEAAAKLHEALQAAAKAAKPWGRIFRKNWEENMGKLGTIVVTCTATRAGQNDGAFSQSWTSWGVKMGCELLSYYCTPIACNRGQWFSGRLLGADHSIVADIARTG